MLTRHIFGYLPSYLVPALASFVGIVVYTHLLTPEEYGHYTLGITGMLLLNNMGFYWLQAALPRLMPKAMTDGTADALRATAYRAFAVMATIFVFGTIIASAVWRPTALIWFILGLGSARSLLNINQSWHRSALNFRRYNLLECGASIIGLAISITLVMGLSATGTSALTGLLLGMLAMIALDRGEITRAPQAAYSPTLLREMLHYGLPLMFSYGLAFIIASSDRFLIEYFLGSHDVGIYAAGYSIMDRIGQIAFMVVALPSFSLTIHQFESEGPAAARAQTYRTGETMVLLTLPTCTGLILTVPQLAALLIGPEFRDGALRVMPYIAAATFCNGLATHYFDHAFHFGKKTRLLLFTQGPAAALNLTLNLLLIPHYGYMGAAYATLAAYVLLLTLSIIVGRRSFPIHFPLRTAAKITAATALMTLVLCTISFPLTLMGLAAMCLLGAATYGLGLLAFNAMNARERVQKLLQQKTN